LDDTDYRRMSSSANLSVTEEDAERASASARHQDSRLPIRPTRRIQSEIGLTDQRQAQK